MTEKRFIFLDGFSLRYTCICDNQKGHRTNGVLKQDEVLELLNHLHEENEQLKKENQKLIEYGRELLEYINTPPKHRKSIFDAVVCFKNKKGDVE